MDLGLPKDADGRWFCNVGDTLVTSGKLQFNTVTGGASGSAVEKHAIRRGFRGEKYILEYEHPSLGLGEAAGAVRIDSTSAQ